VIERTGERADGRTNERSGGRTIERTIGRPGPLSAANFAEAGGGQGVDEKMKVTFVCLSVCADSCNPPLLENNSEITLRPTKHNQLGKRSAWDSEYKY